jgi:hypothetical protein
MMQYIEEKYAIFFKYVIYFIDNIKLLIYFKVLKTWTSSTAENLGRCYICVLERKESMNNHDSSAKTNKCSIYYLRLNSVV